MNFREFLRLFVLEFLRIVAKTGVLRAFGCLSKA